MFTTCSQTKNEPSGDHRQSSVVLVFCPLPVKAPSVFHLPTKAPSFLVGSSDCGAVCVAHSVSTRIRRSRKFVARIHFSNSGFKVLFPLDRLRIKSRTLP